LLELEELAVHADREAASLARRVVSKENVSDLITEIELQQRTQGEWEEKLQVQLDAVKELQAEPPEVFLCIPKSIK